MNFDLLKRGEPDRVNTGVVSHDIFDTLGIKPILGRSFGASDDASGAAGVLILSYSYSRLGPAWRATSVEPMLALRAD